MEVPPQWPPQIRKRGGEWWSACILSSHCHRPIAGRPLSSSSTANSTSSSEGVDHPRWSNSSNTHQVAKEVLTTTVTLTSLSYAKYVTFTDLSTETDRGAVFLQPPILSRCLRQQMAAAKTLSRLRLRVLWVQHRLLLLLTSENLPKKMPRRHRRQRHRQFHRHQLRSRKKPRGSHIRLLHLHQRRGILCRLLRPILRKQQERQQSQLRLNRQA